MTAPSGAGPGCALLEVHHESEDELVTPLLVERLPDPARPCGWPPSTDVLAPLADGPDALQA